MLVFCTGIPRSGSTWAYNVCRLLLSENGSRQLLGGYIGERQDVDKYIQQKMTDLENSASHADILLKTHIPGSQSVGLLRTGIAKNIFTYRDPRDSLCSIINFERNRDFEYVLNEIGGNWEQGNWYRTHTDSLFIRYEDMMANTRREISRIASYLDLTLSEALYQRIEEQTSLQASKKIISGMSRASKSQVFYDGHCAIDQATLLHDNHISHARGKTGRWQEEFSEAQQLLANLILAPWLLEWGYESEESLRVLLKTLMLRTDWKSQGQQMIAQGACGQAAMLYELGTEVESDVTSNYWYLGLALFLMNQDEAAQLAWLTGLFQVTDTEPDRAIAELATILEAEAHAQAIKGNIEISSRLETALNELSVS